MKAQVFHGPGDLRLEEIPLRAPRAGEVTLKIEAALTCGPTSRRCAAATP